jgi:hypothetical protein
MAAGLWLIYNERPIVQLLSHNGVEVINAADYKSNQIDFSELDIPGRKPLWLALDIKTDSEGQVFMDQFVGDILSGKPYSQRFEKYIEMSKFSKEDFQTRVEYIDSTLSGYDNKSIAGLPERIDCTWMPIRSTHLANAYACVSYEAGAIDIEVMQ